MLLQMCCLVGTNPAGRLPVTFYKAAEGEAPGVR